MSTSAPMQQPERKTSLWTAAFVLVCLSNLFFWSALFGTNAMIPGFMGDLKFGDTLIGLAMGSGALSSIPGRMLSGWAIDRYGPRWFLITGAFLTAVTAPMVLISDALWVILISRLLQGLGVALFMNAALGMVAMTSAPDKRGTALAWWGLGNNLANSVGPTTTSALQTASGYPAAFYGAGILGLVSAVVGGMVSTKGTAASGSAPRQVKFFTASALLPGLVGGALGIANGAFMMFAPIRAKELNLANIGYYMTFFGAALIVARMVFGPLSDKKGRAWAVVPGMLLTILSLAFLGVISDPYLALVVPLVFGLGVGAAVPGLVAWVIDRSGNTERATATSTFYIVYDIAVFIGSIGLGKLLEFSLNTAAFSIAGVVAVSLLAYLGFSSRKTEIKAAQ